MKTITSDDLTTARPYLELGPGVPSVTRSGVERVLLHDLDNTIKMSMIVANTRHVPR